MKEKILVTGGSGFIGTNLIIKLVKQGYEVTNLDIKEPKIEVKSIYKDIRSDDIKEIFEQDFDYVIHLAALSNHRFCDNLSSAFSVNTQATLNILNCLTNKNTKKIILASSVVLYDELSDMPIKENSKLVINYNNYTFTKGLCEYIADFFIKQKNLPIIIMRFPNLFGPYQEHKINPNLIPQIIIQALNDKKIEVWNGDPIRDWLYVEDLVDAIITSLESEYIGPINISSNKGISVRDVVSIIANLTNSEVVFLNKEVSGPVRLVCDNELAKKEFKWTPKTELAEGIKKTIDYYKNIL